MRVPIKFGKLLVGEQFYYFKWGRTLWQKTSDNEAVVVYGMNCFLCLGFEVQVWTDDINKLEEIIP